MFWCSYCGLASVPLQYNASAVRTLPLGVAVRRAVATLTGPAGTPAGGGQRRLSGGGYFDGSTYLDTLYYPERYELFQHSPDEMLADHRAFESTPEVRPAPPRAARSHRTQRRGVPCRTPRPLMSNAAPTHLARMRPAPRAALPTHAL